MVSAFIKRQIIGKNTNFTSLTEGFIDLLLKNIKIRARAYGIPFLKSSVRENEMINNLGSIEIII